MVTNGNISKGLTLKERCFLLRYLDDFNATLAYLEISPTSKETSARAHGSRLLKRINEKINWAETLKLYGLDDFRLAQEIDKRLKATAVKFYLGTKLGDFADNSTRMKATELLAEIRGKRKMQLELSGELAHKGYVNISPDDWDEDNDADDSNHSAV